MVFTVCSGTASLSLYLSFNYHDSKLENPGTLQEDYLSNSFTKCQFLFHSRKIQNVRDTSKTSPLNVMRPAKIDITRSSI